MVIKNKRLIRYFVLILHYKISVIKVLKTMKKVALKSAIIIPVFIFSIFLIMTIIGCTSCLFGLDHQFYNCTYCNIFKTIVFVSLIAYLTILFFDIKLVYKHSLNKKNN
jgi:hypothetical protein